MDVEWLILADAAEVTGGKLYLIGGGWNQITVQRFPFQQGMSIAVSFRVPWNQTNEKHSFEIDVADVDGASIARVPGEFEVGRRAGIPAGQDQRAQFVVNVNWTIKKAGGYVVVCRLYGRERRRFPFNVVAAPQASVQPG